MMTLAETHKAKKRQRPEREQQNLMEEIVQQQQQRRKSVEVSSYRGFQSAPKSHYMYNTPLIPKVCRSFAEVILYLSPSLSSS